MVSIPHRLLASALPSELPARMADFGAGWGYLSAAVLSRSGPEVLHLVEAEHDALTAARANIPDPRAQFHWADATGFTLPDRLGDRHEPAVPCRARRAARTGLAFIAAAARPWARAGSYGWSPTGICPTGQALEERFVHLSVLAEDTRFRVWHAKQPRKVKR